VDSYFNYFTEIEEHFQRRRGTTLLLSTLDWALIETWKDAGIGLEAVLRGIDATFDKYERRPSKTRKVNSLAYCSQEILAAAEDMKEAAVGTAPVKSGTAGIEPAEVVGFLNRCATELDKASAIKATISENSHSQKAVEVMIVEAAQKLRELGEEFAAQKAPPRLEDLERRLTVMEERLFAALLSATPDEQLVAVRSEADRELAPYRQKMGAPQIEQLHKQYVHKRLLERCGIPRLSLFYM
jgi:DNA repair ATPase RecN